ncbi:efflux RND transporter periplasmic adaptor subunit [Planctomycetes bacterium TBK1r]|uniref:HlyD family secretion protein n=1 Tax=Stieleria magnilauensis TaxID=2527963 RepID=A0ABX5XUV0_9BACT|nr:HlyD family secretion protein [Planctomycetes bacterium TBK1r]
MKTLFKTIIPNLLLIAVLVGGAYFVGQHQGQKNALASAQPPGDSANSASAATPTAAVRTVIIRQGSIVQQLDAFGVVTPQLGETKFVAAPLEVRVNQILVRSGQRVSADQKLFSLELSPAQKIALSEAKINADTASAELTQVQQRKSERLATNQELSQAQQTASIAQAKFQQMEQQSKEALSKNSAGFEGVVNKIDAQPGQIVPAGSAIVEVVTQKGIEVQLGVEAEDVRLLKEGQAIDISAVLDNTVTDVKATIRLVSESIDPQTRLASVYATLPDDAPLLLGQYVRASAEVDVKQGLIVPRQAVLPNGVTSTVFTIVNGKAVAHEVQVGIDNGKEIQIESKDLKEGMPVITVGSSQVSDGMQVSIAPESPPTTPTDQSSVKDANTPSGPPKQQGNQPGAAH